MPEELWRVVDLMTCGDGIVGDIALPKEELLLPLRRDGAEGGRGNNDIVIVFKSLVVVCCKTSMNKLQYPMSFSCSKAWYLLYVHVIEKVLL